MSFRFVTVALSVLGTGASGAYLGTAPPPTPIAVVAVSTPLPVPLAPRAQQAPAPRAPATTPRAEPKAPAAHPGGGYHIHLESYRSTAQIPESWAKLRAAYPAVLGPLSVSSATVTIPDKGSFVRLLAGPFASRAAADQACAALKQAKHSYCLPVAPAGEVR
jgi:cell division septation protein DedD